MVEHPAQLPRPPLSLSQGTPCPCVTFSVGYREQMKSSKTKLGVTAKRSARAPAKNSSMKSVTSQSKRDLSTANTTQFAQTKEVMIDYYLQLAKEYRDLLVEHSKLIEHRKKVEVEIASIYCQEDRLDQLIREVKRKKLEEGEQQ